MATMQGCHCWVFPPRSGFNGVYLGCWVIILVIECNLGFSYLPWVKLSEIFIPSNSNYHKYLDDNTYLGGRTTAHLMNDDPFVHNISSHTQNRLVEILVEFCLQMKIRFPLTEDEVISKLKILNPDIGLNVKQSPDSIAQLAAHFPTLVR